VRHFRQQKMNRLIEALTATNRDLQALRRRFYIVNTFMIGTRRDYLDALDRDDLDAAQRIWERETGLTGP
jgi:hypothetical protein